MATAVVIQFGSSEAAVALVAGLPAAARAIREVALAGLDECWLEVGSVATPAALPIPAALPVNVRQEIIRMSGMMRVHGIEPVSRLQPAGAASVPATMLPGEQMLVISGEALVDAAAIRAARSTGASINPAMHFRRPGHAAHGEVVALCSTAHYTAAGRAIIKATAKSTDGLVSRNLNRPISQAVSTVLLNVPGIRPIHATIGTAVLAVLMFAVLVVMGSPTGLVAGAILFQAASVFDGVDGEIARATYRTSDRGAMIDSLIDAATNLSFVAGIVINLAQRGHWGPAMFGIAGLSMLALGLTILGTQSRRSGAPISFDGLKARFRDSGSLWGKWMVWLTMRDFVALASFVAVVAGLTDQAIMVFSGVMAVWLAVVLTSHVRQSAFNR